MQNSNLCASGYKAQTPSGHFCNLYKLSTGVDGGTIFHLGRQVSSVALGKLLITAELSKSHLHHEVLVPKPARAHTDSYIRMTLKVIPFTSLRLYLGAGEKGSPGQPVQRAWKWVPLQRPQVSGSCLAALEILSPSRAGEKAGGGALTAWRAPSPPASLRVSERTTMAGTRISCLDQPHITREAWRAGALQRQREEMGGRENRYSPDKPG